MFSSRLPARLAPNAFTIAVRRLRAAGADLVDLTLTNPTLAGLSIPAPALAPLADPDVTIYRPEPLGSPETRAAVAAACRFDGRPPVPADRVLLTASTSEAYGFLFKLLCDPGDDVLAPQPSYPLFDMLASLEGVRLQPYRLGPPGVWHLDRAGVEQAVGPRTRAVLVVSPNNPTGSIIGASDRDWLAALAADRGLAIVCDEVFADYPLAPPPDAATFLDASNALTFTLGGLSKSAGLPQLKLAWTIVGGPDPLVAEAIARMELVADAYLSVSTPVQVAAAALIEAGRTVRARIGARVAGNLARLRDAVAAVPSVTLYEPHAGWSAVLRLPAIESEEALVLRLLDEAHVIVHPGYFFDFPDGVYLALSLLPPPDVFAEGLRRLVTHVGGAR